MFTAVPRWTIFFHNRGCQLLWLQAEIGSAIQCLITYFKPGWLQAEIGSAIQCLITYFKPGWLQAEIGSAIQCLITYFKPGWLQAEIGSAIQCLITYFKPGWLQAEIGSAIQCLITYFKLGWLQAEIGSAIQCLITYFKPSCSMRVSSLIGFWGWWFDTHCASPAFGYTVSCSRIHASCTMTLFQWLEDDKADKRKARSKPTTNISLSSVSVLLLLSSSVFPAVSLGFTILGEIFAYVTIF